MGASTRIRQLFADALEQPPENRRSFVQSATAEPDIRAAVESLLTAHDNAGEFLSDPVIDPRSFYHALGVPPGTRIGAYTIVKLLGEGGHGAVYLAEQNEPVRRRVAIKLIKPGMDSKHIMARFAAERQVLALMEHSHIARVFDAGATPSGHPYFVMEYVDGPPITTFCKNLPVGERLELFSQVCMAVQHAHQKGIIHRDLKPANILVAMENGKPSPKVIDFGIAKILEAAPEAVTVLTKHGQFLGTPQYMSPEQAGAAPDVDTRTDIYALGAILYELLTGSPAFDPAQLKAAAAAEVTRIIREVDPPLPSVRLKNLTASAAAPELTRTARKDIAHIQGELDWIVMRSMDKDRQRRYETAESLAADIQRHLADEPVLAGPPSRMYRFSKFARRNRAILATATVVMVALAVGLVIAAVALQHARRQRDQARMARAAAETQRIAAEEAQARAEASEKAEAAARAKAEAQAQRLFSAQTFLYRMLFSTSPPPPVPMLDFAAHHIMDKEFVNQPAVRSPVHLALGGAYRDAGLLEDAERQFAYAMETVRESEGESLHLASAMNNRAILLMDLKKLNDAEKLLTDSIALYKRLIPHDKVVWAPAVYNLGRVHLIRKEYAEAVPLLEEALKMMRESKAKPPRLANFFTQLALALEGAGRAEDAAKIREEYKKLTEAYQSSTSTAPKPLP